MWGETGKLVATSKGGCARTDVDAWYESFEKQLPHPFSLRASCPCLPNQYEATVGLANGKCMTWDLETKKCVRTWKAHSRSVTSIAYKGDGTQLATGPWWCVLLPLVSSVSFLFFFFFFFFFFLEALALCVCGWIIAVRFSIVLLFVSD